MHNPFADLISKSFSPAVLVTASDGAQKICAKNNLKVADLFKPFGTLQGVNSLQFRSSSKTLPLRNFNIRFLSKGEFNQADAFTADKFLENVLVPSSSSSSSSATAAAATSSSSPPVSPSSSAASPRSSSPSSSMSPRANLIKDIDAAVWTKEDAITNADDVPGFLRTTPDVAPWFKTYCDELHEVLRHDESTFADQPFAIITVIASTDKNSDVLLDDLQSLRSLPRQFQRGVYDAQVFRSFVILHDNHSNDNEALTRATNQVKGIRSNMRDPAAIKTTGCKLLNINSLSPKEPSAQSHEFWRKAILRNQTLFPYECTAVAMPLASVTVDNPDRDPEVPIDPNNPLASLANPLAQRGLSAKRVSSSGGQFTINAYGQFLGSNDMQDIGSYVADLVVHGIIPTIEKKMAALTEKIAAARAGFRNQMKLFFSARPEKSASPTGQGADATYALTSTEAQIRLLADMAMIMQDYETAAKNYRQIVSDYKTDKAWRHYASGQECLGIALMLTDNRDGSNYREAASSFEQAISTYYVVNDLRRATRCAIYAAEAYKTCYWSNSPVGGVAAAMTNSSFPTRIKEASILLLRASEKEQMTRGALLLEQAAYCYLYMKPPLVRKYAFHLVMAGHLFHKCNHKLLGVRCYTSATSVYVDRGWYHVEDHIHYNLGRDCYNLNMLQSAVHHFTQLVGKSRDVPLTPRQCLTVEGGTAAYKQPKEKQSLMFKEFIVVVKKWLASNQKLAKPASGKDEALKCGDFPAGSRDDTDTTKEVAGFSLPAIHDDSVTVRTCNRQTVEHAYSTKAWNAAVLRMPPMYAPGDPLANKPLFVSTPKLYVDRDRATVVGEFVTVTFIIHNPIQVTIEVTNMRLRCMHKRPEADDGQGDDSTTVSVSVPPTVCSRQAFLLGPLESREVELSVKCTVEGTLKIDGVTWTVNDFIHGYHPFKLKDSGNKHEKSPQRQTMLIVPVIKSMGLLDVAVDVPSAQRSAGDDSVGVDDDEDDVRRRNSLDAASYYASMASSGAASMPSIVSSALPHVSVLHGECFKSSWILENTGSQALSHIKLKVSHPAFIAIGRPHVLPSKDSRESAGKTEESVAHVEKIDWNEGTLSIPEAFTLLPGQAASLPVWVRACTVGTQAVSFLVKYSTMQAAGAPPEDSSAEPSHPNFINRVLHLTQTIDVQPVFNVKVYAKSSAANVDCTVLGFDLEDVSTSKHAKIVLRSAYVRSRGWQIGQLLPSARGDMSSISVSLMEDMTRAETMVGDVEGLSSTAPADRTPGESSKSAMAAPFDVPKAQNASAVESKDIVSLFMSCSRIRRSAYEERTSDMAFPYAQTMLSPSSLYPESSCTVQSPRRDNDSPSLSKEISFYENLSSVATFGMAAGANSESSSGHSVTIPRKPFVHGLAPYRRDDFRREPSISCVSFCKMGQSIEEQKAMDGIFLTEHAALRCMAPPSLGNTVDDLDLLAFSTLLMLEKDLVVEAEHSQLVINPKAKVEEVDNSLKLDAILFWTLEQESADGSVISHRFGFSHVLGSPCMLQQQQGACSLKITLDYPQEVAIDFSRGAAAASVPCVLRVRNILDDKTVNFTFDVVPSDEEFALQSKQFSKNPSNNIRGRYLWTGRTKLHVPCLAPQTVLDIPLMCCFFSPGQYNLNRFRFTVDTPAGAGRQPHAANSDSMDVAEKKSRVFFFPFQFLTTVHNSSAQVLHNRDVHDLVAFCTC